MTLKGCMLHRSHHLLNLTYKGMPFYVGDECIVYECHYILPIVFQYWYTLQFWPWCHVDSLPMASYLKRSPNSTHIVSRHEWYDWLALPYLISFTDIVSFLSSRSLSRGKLNIIIWPSDVRQNKHECPKDKGMLTASNRKYRYKDKDY